MLRLMRMAALFALLGSLGVGARADGSEIDSEIIKKGEAVYMGTCFACHGQDGKGVLPGTPNLRGKKSPLLQERDVVKSRILNGYQSKGSPMAMPPKGGNAKLSEEEIDAVIDYMKVSFLKKRG